MTRRLALYATAAVLVRLADEGARVAMTLLALHRTGSAALGGLLVAVLLVPHVVAAPLVGLLTDRARRPQLVVGAACGGFGLALALAAATLGSAPLPVVLAVLFLGGCCGPAVTGALTSLVAALVRPEALSRAFGLDALTYNTAGIAGPAAAAVVASTLSPAAATFALAGCAVAGGVLVTALPVGRRRAPRPDDAGDLLGGVRAIARDHVLAPVTIATSLGQVGAGTLPVVAAVFAQRHGDAPAAGWLLTAVAVGGLAGSLLWTWRPAPVRLAAGVVMVGLVATGIPLLLGAMTSSILVLAALLVVSGACNGPLFGALLLVRHQHAPEHLRSQVFALSAGAKLTANAVGAALAGLLAGVPGSWQLVLAGAPPVLAGAAGARTLRRRPQEPTLTAGKGGVELAAAVRAPVVLQDDVP